MKELVLRKSCRSFPGNGAKILIEIEKLQGKRLKLRFSVSMLSAAARAKAGRSTGKDAMQAFRPIPLYLQNKRKEIRFEIYMIGEMRFY